MARLLGLFVDFAATEFAMGSSAEASASAAWPICAARPVRISHGLAVAPRQCTLDQVKQKKTNLIALRG
jgi:hypothetical protein